jgi:hypothetical protein
MRSKTCALTVDVVVDVLLKTDLEATGKRPTVYRRKLSLAAPANTKRRCLARCYSGYIINTTLETAS